MNLGPWCETAKMIFHDRMSPYNKTYFSTLVTKMFGNIRIPTSNVSLPYSAQKKCYLLVDVSVVSIDRGIVHFCCFGPGPKIAFPFAVFKENNMLTEWGTSQDLTCMIHARWEFPRSPTWLKMYYLFM